MRRDYGELSVRLPKLVVEGSNPFARSSTKPRAIANCAGLLSRTTAPLTRDRVMAGTRRRDLSAVVIGLLAIAPAAGSAQEEAPREPRRPTARAAPGALRAVGN